MKNNKGIAAVAIVFITLFGVVAAISASKIPARQHLKTQLIDSCVKTTGADRADCKAQINSMTQKEREAAAH